MNFLQEKFSNTGLKQNHVANRLGITERTLNRWLNLKGIEFDVKFLEFLYICKICPFEFLNIYYKTFDYKCFVSQKNAAAKRIGDDEEK